MNLNDAAEIINCAMDSYGLREAGWRWEWSRSRATTLGTCYEGRKLLHFSGPLFEVNTEDVCLDTILHEIAHALAGNAAGHGPVWRAMARKLGASPTEKAYDAVSAPHKWHGSCGCSGRLYKYHRLSQRLRNGACRRCGERLRWVQNF